MNKNYTRISLVAVVALITLTASMAVGFAGWRAQAARGAGFITELKAGLSAQLNTKLLGRNKAAGNNAAAAPVKSVAPSSAMAFATITVDTTADDNVVNGNCTLREAITAANTNAAVDACAAGVAGADVIEFNLGAGTPTIALTSGLPDITDPVTINGNTGGSTRVELNGSGAGASISGLTITAGNSTIAGLVINRFNGYGIVIRSNGNTVKNCYIGTDANGAMAQANAYTGIYVENAMNNTIGGTSVADRNVISGNNAHGVEIFGSTASLNKVTGNFIGTDVTGAVDLGNSFQGVRLQGASSNTIGGTNAGEGNVISGNDGNGIFIVTAAASMNKVSGNFIGTNAAGTADLGNNADGVRIESAPTNTIGGTTAAERNVISGNDRHGVFIIGATATGNKMIGNFIGTDANGTADLGNTEDGVNVDDAPSNIIGGMTAAERNVISGNNRMGVYIFTGSIGNQVLGNYLGTDVNGTADLGNTFDGVLIEDAPNNTVGGTTAAARNLISGNDRYGVRVFGVTATGNKVIGNAIFNNSNLGIDLGPNGAVTANDAGDGDTGPNNLQNFPVLTCVTSAGGSTTIGGTFNSLAATAFRIEYFVNDACDGSGNGEGQTLLGTQNVTTDASGNVTLNATGLPVVAVGKFITATATLLDAMGDPVETSEFSACLAVSAPPTLAINDVTLAEGNVGTTNMVFTVTLTGAQTNCLPVTVAYATANGTATAGSDYTATSGTLTFNAPHASNSVTQTITVPVTGELVPEPDETFFVNLTSPTNATISDNQGVGTITNDDCPLTLIVNDAGDVGDATPGNGVCETATGNGVCTLRAAIMEANARTDCANVIEFNLGTGTPTINVLSALPAITDPVMINGKTGGATRVELNGISAGNANGLTITAGNSTIAGLVINRFYEFGILLQGNGGNTIKNCYIGTNAAGTAALGNRLHGVYIEDASNNTVGGTTAGERNLISGNGQSGVGILGAMGNKVIGNYIGTDVNGTADLGNAEDGVRLNTTVNNTVGGTTAGERNLISGNNEFGVHIFNANSSGNIVIGNYIGTDVNGTADLGNTLHGVLIESAPNNTVGGTTAGERNLISGNDQSGVGILGAMGNKVIGNYIGTDVNGTADLGNAQDGVRLNTTMNNTVGGLTAGERNLISGNDRYGLSIINAAATGNIILGNAIFNNTNLGIDLGENGVTANDTGDGDTGANGLQNFPVLTCVTSAGGVTTIGGTLNSLATTAFRIEYFVNDACDASGNGEGQTLLGTQNVTTDGSGNVALSLTVPTIAVGKFITATATRLDGSGNPVETSEFSACLAVSAPPTLAISDVTMAEGNSGTTNFVFTVTLSNAQTWCSPVTVNYATANGTATAGSDYTATSGTLTFAPPHASNTVTQTITVPVTGDTTFELGEVFTVNLTNPINATIADNQGLGTITNDEAPPTLSINDVTQAEGNAGTTAFMFTVSLSAPSPQTVTVNVASANGTATLADNDYVELPVTTLSFAPGETSKTVTVNVNGDTKVEANETFNVNLSNPTVVISDGQGLGTINNDDSCPTQFTVNDLGDAADATPGDYVCETATGNGVCTLRAAIMEANAIGATCSPLTIRFSVPPGTINLATVLPNLNHPNLTITGPGANQLDVHRNAASQFRIFTVNSGKIVNLSGLTVSNGDHPSQAGGIQNNGTLTMTDCVVSGNRTGQGGGLQNDGVLTMTGCTVSGNTAINNDGGGLAVYGTSTTLTNCTFSGNHAFGSGGGLSITSGGQLLMTNCTVTNNTAANMTAQNVGDGGGGGLFIFTFTNPVTPTLKNTLIVGNSLTSGTTHDVFTKYNFQPGSTNNLLGAGDSGGLSHGVDGNQLNVANALLAPLGNYGGTTQTHALLPGSPAINAGTDSGAPTTDQRGIARVGTTDIGAYESRGFTLTVNSGNNQSTIINTAFANPLKVNVTPVAAGEPVNGGQVTFTPPGMGATATLATSPATIASGMASVTATANNVAGSYVVMAGANGGNAVSFSLTAICPVISFTATSVAPTCNGGNNGSLTFTPSGGSAPYQFSINGGQSFSASNQFTGLMAGVYQVIVKDANGCQSAVTPVTLTQPAALGLSPAALPTAVAGTPLTQIFTANGGTGTKTLQLNGALPNWLSFLAATGTLSGTAPTPGTVSFSITVTDQNNCTFTQSYTLTIVCPAITLTSSLAAGVQGAAYNQTVAAAPAGTTYSYAVTTNALPPGLSLNAATGAITGTPSAAGNYAFNITATGWGGCTKSQSYNILITGTCVTVTVSPATLPNGTLGTAYPATNVSATGGTAPYTFAVTQGALPAGLALNPATGAITGTPTAAGTSSFRITATATGGCTGSRLYVVSVTCGTLTFSPAGPALPNGVKGANYPPVQLAVTPGTGYTFNLQLGSLPPGYTLSAAGVLSGITNQSGTWTFTVRALAGTCQATKQYTLTITGAQAALAQINDYDGDGKADLTLFATNGEWRILYSRGSSDQQPQTVLWGMAGDVPVSGDYDGDGKTDLAVFRPGDGTWHIKRSSTGNALVKAWGLATDVPVPGDYDGDGQTDIAIWRGAEGNWYILRSSDQQLDVVYWGLSLAPFNDVPVAGDYDGDRKTDVAVFRRTNGGWYVRLSGNGNVLIKGWGLGTDVPVVNDYDGDGKADLAVWRGSAGVWYIQTSSNGATRTQAWGAGFAPYFDQAVPGDYDGDGQADLAVWRTGEASWYVMQSNDGKVTIKTQGQPGDAPVVQRLR